MQDDESGIYAQPDVTSGELPATAQQYAQIEWQEEYLGDVVYDKPPKFLVSQLNCNVATQNVGQCYVCVLTLHKHCLCKCKMYQACIYQSQQH